MRIRTRFTVLAALHCVQLGVLAVIAGMVLGVAILTGQLLAEVRGLRAVVEAPCPLDPGNAPLPPVVIRPKPDQNEIPAPPMWID